jgi:hypothetical protein
MEIISCETASLSLERKSVYLYADEEDDHVHLSPRGKIQVCLVVSFDAGQKRLSQMLK